MKNKVESKILPKKAVRLLGLSLLCIIFLVMISSVNAEEFSNNSTTGSDIQKFIDDETGTDIVLKTGNYNNNIIDLNISRNVTIKGDGQVNIVGPSSATLFNIKSSVTQVTIINLNISGYGTAINISSNVDNIQIKNNIIKTTGNSIILEDSNGASYKNILIQNNEISGYNGFYGGSINGLRNDISFVNNNITGNSGSGVHINLLNSYNTITFTNNKILGESNYGVYLAGSYGNNTINFDYNNITGTSSSGVYLSAMQGINNYIIFTNNNIKVIGNGQNGVRLSVYDSNNTIIFTNNNISDGNNRTGVYLKADNSTNNITFTNNNINGTRTGVYLIVYESNNTISFKDNNLTGTGLSPSGLYLYEYDSNNTLLEFVNNSFSGSLAGIYVNTVFGGNLSNLSLINNTIKSEGSNGVGINFATRGNNIVKDIVITGNNIIATGYNGIGINFTESGHDFNNIIVNYNRIVAGNIGLNFANIPNTLSNVNFDYNWWGNNNPILKNFNLANWFVMELSVNGKKTIVNATINQNGTQVNLSYQLVLFENSIQNTNLVSYANLPDFMVDLSWTGIGVINHLVNAKGYYSEIVNFNKNNGYILTAISDNINIKLDGTRDNYLVNFTVTKTANETKVINGQTVTYTVVVTNNGPDNATGVILNEKLPSSLIYINNSLGLAYDHVNGIWNIGNLNQGETVTLVITVRVNGVGIIINNVNITSNEENINNETNNTNITANITSTQSTDTSSIAFPKIQTVSAHDNPNSLKINDTINLKHILNDINGNLLADAEIHFYVNGNYIGSSITDANGIAIKSYTIKSSGVHNITTNYLGNNTHHGSSATSLLNIRTDLAILPTIKTELKITVNGDKVSARLTDIMGRAIKGLKIDFRIGDKVIGTATTDANGIGTIYYKDAEKYIITAEFIGNDRYEGSRDTYYPEDSSSASMKNTGFSNVAAIISLLASFSILVYRKKF